MKDLLSPSGKAAVKIYLLNPRVQRMLRISLIVVTASTSVWTASAGYLFLSSSRATAEERARLGDLRQKISELTLALQDKKKEAVQSASLKTGMPNAMGGWQFASDFSRVAEESQAAKLSFRFKAAPPQTGANTPVKDAKEGDKGADANKGSSTPPTPPAPTQGPGGIGMKDGWAYSPFECEITGSYGSIARTMQGCAGLPYVFDVMKSDLVRTRVEKGGVVLTIRLSGTLYGLAEAAKA